MNTLKIAKHTEHINEAILVSDSTLTIERTETGVNIRLETQIDDYSPEEGEINLTKDDVRNICSFLLDIENWPTQCGALSWLNP